MIFDLNRLSSDEKTTKGYCKGTVIYKENVYHDADILYIFNTSQNISDIESILSLIRGYFSIILPLNDSIVLISDQLNSVPLYYNCDLITDHFNSRYNKDIDNDNLMIATKTRYLATTIDPLWFHSNADEKELSRDFQPLMATSAHRHQLDD